MSLGIGSLGEPHIEEISLAIDLDLILEFYIKDPIQLDFGWF